MSLWKLTIVCLVMFTVSADMDASIELLRDLPKLQSLRGALGSRKGSNTELDLFDETVELIGTQTPYPGSMADDQYYIKQLWQLENAARVGWDPKTQKWIGNAAPEQGGKIDYGPGLKLPYKAGGYTQAEIDQALTNKIHDIEATLRKNVASLGKNYDTLCEAQKMLLVDYSYNTGNAFGVFPKMSRAIVNVDIQAMNAEYKRYWVDQSGQRREVLGRNQWTKSVIDSFGK